MKIAVNTRLLIPNKLEGIGWFSHETLQRITTQHPEHEFVFIFDRPYGEQFVYSENVTPKVAYPPARHPYLWYLFFEWGIPHLLKSIKPDLFLSTDGWIPLGLKMPVVNVIHDINFEKHPEYIPKGCLGYYKKYFHQFAQQATRLGTVSEYSKKEIHNLYGLDNEKIDVLYNGANDNYQPLSKNAMDEVKNEITNGAPYFLFVGLVTKRKNLERLYKAFDKFKETDAHQTKLVVVGDRKYSDADTENTYQNMRYKEDVIFLGRLSLEKLTKVTGAALAMMYISLYEGFGIPIVEAFKAKVPVVTSNITSMPEVAGDAAFLVNPTDIDHIVDAMNKVATQPQQVQALIEKGVERARIFTWDKSAERLWKTIEKVM